MVRPKKSLGQHFLKDQNIAMQIVDALQLDGRQPVVEIGPGTGVLTQYLLKRDIDLKVAEIDRDSVAYLKKNYPQLEGNIIDGDVLEMNWNEFAENSFHVIGNFPYNISSQIFFKVLEHRDKVDQVVGMLQKEVAERIVSDKGNKVYGILSVLLQAYYDIELLFKVPPEVFFPPPKVMSAVIRLKRNKTERLDCDEKRFKAIVKQGFQTRRKTLRNALKILNLPPSITSMKLLDLRAEQLSVADFVFLTQQIEKSDG
ncbi:MAG TPA: 16S rRNA (adenine(1518)-N(6)/adenine(1519)-N(6))-dimethyltransferase RsmA [Cyclobacteriaceae bacterium]|nr:16S rRNA (adenine(1518)-N(6)/adenine(1519)-N(6))-dimethyltransferase RsmA [Cyclobacteriaceae bacterium]